MEEKNCEILSGLVLMMEVQLAFIKALIEKDTYPSFEDEIHMTMLALESIKQKNQEMITLLSGQLQL